MLNRVSSLGVNVGPTPEVAPTPTGSAEQAWPVGLPRTASGYAARFGITSEVAPGYFERIAPGAFTESLLRDDIRALFNHEHTLLLGRTSSGTLQLREDAQGLHYTVELPPCSYSKDLVALVQRGDLTGCSFGMDILEETLEDDPAYPSPIHVVRRVKLYEVTIGCTFPAYEATSVEVRKAPTPTLEQALVTAPRRKMAQAWFSL